MNSEKPIPITEDEYFVAMEEYWGICLNCEHIQEGGVEPDARNYPCENCDQNQIFGFEEALLMGKLEIA